MNPKTITAWFFGSLLVSTALCGADIEREKLFPELIAYVQARVAEFDQIPADRKAQLQELATFVRSRQSAGDEIRLTFICTHNSRRSQMAQLWTAVAASYYQVGGVKSYSGGTEETAFNPRAVAALERAGFQITTDQITSDLSNPSNPPCSVAYATGMEPMVCFSKVYDSDPNPDADFCAVMTCSQADESCPLVRGATHRIRLPYDDPKVSDGSPVEAQTYDERCTQIARELLYAFTLVK